MTPTLAITITGVDEWTDLDQVHELLADHIEVGILLTANPDGRPRYPSREWIRGAVLKIGHAAAVHVCGGTARNRVLAGDYKEILLGVRRIQINGEVTPAELHRLAALYPHHDLITQHNAVNAGLLGLCLPRHQVLVDGSAGQGIVPTAWVAPDTSKPVGFAGGLGPMNVREHLPAITAVARHKAWIDMESRLRNEADHFDVDLAAAAIEAARNSRRSAAAA